MRINGTELRIQKIIRWALCHEPVDSNCVLMDFNSRNNQSYTGSPESLVSTYLFSLPEYYNGANDRTLDYLLPDSNAYNKLTANKASGDFRDHMTYSTYIETVEQMSETRYSVYAYREYSHENSGGVYEAYVRYNVVQQNGRYYIVDYTELRNVPVQ